MTNINKWIGISGSWRLSNSKIEADVRREVRNIILEGNGIVTGGALNVDYQATDEVIKLNAFDQLKIFIPTTLEIFAAHYRKRSGEEVVTPKQAQEIIAQLTLVKQKNPNALIENQINTVLTKETYYARNTDVVDASDELLAFQVNQSQGTQDTIDKARAKKLPVKIFSYTIN